MNEVVVRVSEDKETISVYLKSNGFEPKVMSIPVSEVDGVDPLNLQIKLGVVIYNALDINCNADKYDDESELLEADAKILRMAEEGDPAAQNAMAVTCMQDCLRDGDIDLLDQAEVWLKKSADSGYPRAEKFLSGTWSELKADYRNRILGSGSNNRDSHS